MEHYLGMNAWECVLCLMLCLWRLMIRFLGHKSIYLFRFEKITKPKTDKIWLKQQRHSNKLKLKQIHFEIVPNAHWKRIKYDNALNLECTNRAKNCHLGKCNIWKCTRNHTLLKVQTPLSKCNQLNLSTKVLVMRYVWTVKTPHTHRT